MQWQAVADYQDLSEVGATLIYNAIVANDCKRFNLGLATGNTMISLYSLLAEKLNHNRIPLDKLHTYNLDEYVDGGCAVPEDHLLSYRRYMRENLFCRFDAGLGFGEDNIHFPNPADPERFDRELAEAGGLDFQLLGIGFNGHIAFNEPEDASKVSVEAFADRPSRVIELTALTLETNARLTAGGDHGIVPHHAVTMGMKPILAAREILLLACFSEQQKPLQIMRNGSPTPQLPASYLLGHANATVIYTADKINLE